MLDPLSSPWAQLHFHCFFRKNPSKKHYRHSMLMTLTCVISSNCACRKIKQDHCIREDFSAPFSLLRALRDFSASAVKTPLLISETYHHPKDFISPCLGVKIRNRAPSLNDYLSTFSTRSCYKRRKILLSSPSHTQFLFGKKNKKSKSL